MHVSRKQQDKDQGNDTDNIGQRVSKVFPSTPALPVDATLMSGVHTIAKFANYSFMRDYQFEARCNIVGEFLMLAYASGVGG